MADVVNSETGRRIVVAVDESEESTYALRWFLRNLLRAVPAEGSEAGDTLILVYARPSPRVYPAMDGAGRTLCLFYLFDEEVAATMDKHSKDVMEKAQSICEGHGNVRRASEAGFLLCDVDQVKVEAKVCIGDARDVICQVVEKLGADLLVMGSHGYGFIKRQANDLSSTRDFACLADLSFLGSVSHHCARKAKCPVLIVKRQAK
ncbi:unnamed protein product [Musa textilis]